MQLARWLMGYFSIVILAAAAVPCRADARKITTVEGMTEYRLDNGLRVLLVPDPTKPTLTTNLTVLVGSRHEGYGEAGMAHLLEHMLFKGTPTFPDPKKLMTEKGARWNGTTWLDRTNYFETVPASDENLDLCIRFEADRLVNCPIRQEDLSSEMTVVRNEFEIGENDPDEVLSKQMQAVAYDWHNYGKSTIGNRSDIERVPADRLRVFYKKYYQPDNAMIIVAGKFDEPKALQLVEKYFDPLPKPDRKLEEPYTEEPPQDGERTVTVRRVGDVGEVAMLYHVPAGPDPQFAAVDTLVQVLTYSPAAPLYKALVETHKAASVGGFVEGLHDPGYAMFFATVPKGQSVEEVRQIMADLLDHVASREITGEQVERIKRRFESVRDREMADTSRLAIDLSNWAAQGDWRLFFIMRDRMERVSPSDVKEMSRKFLKPSNRTVGMFIPSKDVDRAELASRPDVESMLKDYKGREAVAAGEQLDPDPLKIEARVHRQDLVGGIKAAFLPKKARKELIHLRLTLRYGNEQSLQGTRIAAQLLPRLMTRGTKHLSRQQIQDSLDAYRASLRTTGEPGRLSFSLDVQRPHLAEALDLLRQVVREPGFPSDELEILRREELASLDQARSDPIELARTSLVRKLNPYSMGDPRYQPTIPEEAELTKAVTLAQIEELYRQQIGSGAGELSAVGDFDEQDLLPALKKMVDHWDAPVKYERLTWKSAEPVSFAQAINTPDKANAYYAAGTPVPMTDNDEQYPALLLADQVLGGGPASRLWGRLREKEGFSYGTGSMLTTRTFDPAGRLLMLALCNPQNIQKLKKAADEELRRLLKDGIPDKELEAARSEFLRSRLMGRTDDGRIADMLSGQLYAKRTMQYEADLEDKIGKLDAQQVMEAARKYIDPDKLVVITAGDFDKR